MVLRSPGRPAEPASAGRAPASPDSRDSTLPPIVTVGARTGAAPAGEEDGFSELHQGQVTHHHGGEDRGEPDWQWPKAEERGGGTERNDRADGHAGQAGESERTAGRAPEEGNAAGA